MREEVARRKKKIETVRKERTSKCKVICLCSLTSTIHIIAPLVKVLHRLGTVQIISEDKSLTLASLNLESEFNIGDVKVSIVDEVTLLEDDEIKTFKQFDYNIVITQNYVPSGMFKIDKYVMLNRRHHFREQITSPEERYIPMVSVFDPKLFSKEELEREKARVYVNERLISCPPFSSVEDSLNSLLHGVGSREFRFKSPFIDFTAELLNGIDGCDKPMIKKFLLERGEVFVSFD